MERLGRKLRELMVDEIAGLVKDSPYLFFVNFQKLPVSKVETLRRTLKKSSSDLKVVKNSVLRLALKKRKLDSLCDLVEGSCAVTFGKNDPIKTSKLLFNFSRGEESFVIKGGYIDGEVLFADRIKELALLPSREVLLARVVGSIISPVSGLVNVLKGNIQKLVYALDAITSAKGGSASGEKKEEKGG